MAFIPASSFTPHASKLPAVAPPRKQCTYTPCMVSPKHVRRTEEIKRLQKQLEELRASQETSDIESVQTTQSQSPPPQQTAPTPTPPQPHLSSSEAQYTVGRHGEKAHFLSISSLSTDDYFPIILSIAGTVPGLKTSELLSAPAPSQSNASLAGNIFTTQSPGTHSVVALPQCELVARCSDPVIVLASPDAVSISQLPCEQDGEVFVLVDRVAETFDKRKFYAWDVDGMVKIGWSDEEKYPRIGNVIMGQLEVRQELRKKKSCWEEENETYA